MKFECIFAMKVRQTFNDIQCCQWVFLYPYASGYRKDMAVSIPTGHPRQQLLYVESLATFREANGFSCTNTSNFIGMPNSHEICVGAKQSTTSTRRNRAKSISSVSNPDADQSIADVLIELTEAYKVEKDAKNKAYYFILSNGLLDRFADFCRDYHSCDPHKDCIEYLLSKC